MANIFTGQSYHNSPAYANRMGMASANHAFRSALQANPNQVASWFAQQDPQTQRNILGAGQFGTETQTPWGMVGGANGAGRAALFSSALVNGGINQNAMNQMINNNSYNPGTNSGIWNHVPGAPGYGPSSYDASGWDSAQPGITQKTQFDPNAYSGQGNNGAGDWSHIYGPTGTPNTTPNNGGNNNGGGNPNTSPGGVYQGVPNSQNAINMLQNGINGSWNPNMPVYTGPAGSTGDWGSGINANGTPVNSGAWRGNYTPNSTTTATPTTTTPPTQQGMPIADSFPNMGVQTPTYQPRARQGSYAGNTNAQNQQLRQWDSSVTRVG